MDLKKDLSYRLDSIVCNFFLDGHYSKSDYNLYYYITDNSWTIPKINFNNLFFYKQEKLLKSICQERV